MTDFFENLLSNGELQEKIAELQGIIDAYKMSENEANEIIAELKEEVKQLHNGRNPEELYTLFGQPIKYWEELKAENEKLKKELKNNKLEYQLELNTYNVECGNLLEENKELAHYLADMTERRNKANTCLQEIKAIAEENKDTVQYGEICRSILMIITKTEEE